MEPAGPLSANGLLMRCLDHDAPIGVITWH